MTELESKIYYAIIRIVKNNLRDNMDSEPRDETVFSMAGFIALEAARVVEKHRVKGMMMKRVWTVLWVDDGVIQMESFKEKEGAEKRANAVRMDGGKCSSLKVISGYDVNLCAWKNRIEICD